MYELFNKLQPISPFTNIPFKSKHNNSKLSICEYNHRKPSIHQSKSASEQQESTGERNHHEHEVAAIVSDQKHIDTRGTANAHI